MARRKKPPTETPTQAPTQPQETPKVESKPQTQPQTQLPFEVRKISNEEYVMYNTKPESEYVKIAKLIVEKALESDSPLLIKLPPDLSVRRIVPILAKIVSDLWKSGTKIEFKASYKNNEIVIKRIKG